MAVRSAILLVCGTLLTVGSTARYAAHAQSVNPRPERQSAPHRKLFFALQSAQDQQAAPNYARMTGDYGSLALPTERPGVLWKFLSRMELTENNRIQMESLSDAVVGGDTLYFSEMGDPARVVAVNCRDGRSVWRYDHLVRGGNGQLGLDQEHVYFASSLGVTALNRTDGRLVWHHLMQLGTGEGVPIPIHGRLYVSGYDGFAYALDCQTGRVIWKHDLMESATPDRPGFDGHRAGFPQKPARPRGAACDGELFIQGIFDQSRLVAIDCLDGDRRWTFQASGWIEPAPTIADDRVLICSQDKFLYCLDRETGRLLWKFETPTWNASRVAVHDGSVYLPVHRGRLYRLDLQTGELLQSFDPSKEEERYGSAHTFPIVTDRQVLFTTGDGRVLSLDAENLQRQWELRPSQHSELFTDPMTDGQRIFVTSKQDLEKRGESAIVAIGRPELGEKTTLVLGAEGVLEGFQEDVKDLALSNQKGPEGSLYFIRALHAFAIVFPENKPTWDVTEQLRQAISMRQESTEESLARVIEAARLDENQIAVLRIVHARYRQSLFRQIRELESDLKRLSWDDYQASNRSIENRRLMLETNVAKWEPLAPVTSAYGILPKLLNGRQRELLTRYYLSEDQSINHLLNLEDEQRDALDRMLVAKAQNPLDLRPASRTELLRRLWHEEQAQVRNLLNEDQAKLLHLIVKN